MAKSQRIKSTAPAPEPEPLLKKRIKAGSATKKTETKKD